MYPFYHPTSVVVVDDDPMFLQSFDFYFGDSFLCHAFNDPKRALDFIGARRPNRPNPRNFVASAASLPTDPMSTGILNAAAMSQLVRDADRFGQVSVAIVDYDMPSMNGIELCRRMKRIPVRTILLTGKAGKDVAVRAFNEQVIDCFLTKQDPNLAARLRQEVARLQRSYFADTTGEIKVMCALDEARFLSDIIFTTLFEAILRSENVQEYYLTVEPLGILMVRADGSTVFMLVMDDARLQAHLEIAVEESAPLEFICRLEEGEILPYFATATGFYQRGLESSWREQVWPARVVRGEEIWRYAMIELKGREQHPFADVTTFHDYRRQLHH